ncbi:hypothetical protein LX32DRAFT_354976 [Colletotrichum zoysiae]|uniref:Uncharacterized protein n=1 Tax=Colletotrichum zoysiae TaxID=1216348 RepID=A0AAD9M5D0_9PEZI|nr:hypothetical protein LX32DRAFT_354976 [Colletotrichum zoysiae]
MFSCFLFHGSLRPKVLTGRTVCAWKHLERKGGMNGVKGQAASKCRPNPPMPASPLNPLSVCLCPPSGAFVLCTYDVVFVAYLLFLFYSPDIFTTPHSWSPSTPTTVTVPPPIPTPI